MARRGSKRRLELETEYWRPLLSGVGTFEACRLASTGRKTGYRWWAENGGLQPARMVKQERSSRYLSLMERQRIATTAAAMATWHTTGQSGRRPSREWSLGQPVFDRWPLDPQCQFSGGACR
jgi:transposase, IS30 family